MGAPTWSTPQRGSNSHFTAAPGQVLVGRSHYGDENGRTSYEYAKVS
ncbi:hypothetical protein [Streptomyces sp. I05A-00742]|nr:hypothetical protein [Streptomyces sp. I05A-00742]